MEDVVVPFQCIVIVDDMKECAGCLVGHCQLDYF